ncbi:MAG: hypothetical protein JWN73_4887 [Betaproteobacteria bacterium]|nr:hypothetical protein [Betaproteobacteria bacterium]
MNIAHTLRGPVCRNLVCLLVLALAAGGAARADSIAAYPERPIKFVVGYPPGQTVDISARAYGTALAKELGQPIFIDNKPGANGIVAAQIVKAAEPDGYTMLFGTSGQLTINPSLYAKLPYSALTDFVPVGMGSMGRLYLVTNKDLPVKTLKELIVYSKARAGKLSYGSGGTGITAHLAMELLKSATGMDLLHVPFKGSPAALNSLLAGDVQVLFDSGALVLPQIKSEKINLLAVSSKERAGDFPNVPTVAEQGFPGFEVIAWSGMVAPAKTPPAILEKMNAAMLKVSRTEAVLTPVHGTGSEATQLTVAQFSDLLRNETAKWAKAANAAGIKPE